ncbi:MAG: hypothetical protein A2259_00975 [Candidatus Moranbacteria bacterium RIFOXYA2_FULL_43_15]|nr:MAG: hypothetical protein A2259_00975 [Candidatus Moranbacteria bacterium RIFOXYA2_FULL_43_15]
MKRVICWDIWGTIIETSYTGQTYVEYLSQWKDADVISATVRNVLMTHEAKRSQIAFDAMADDRPLNYEETAKILCARLFDPVPLDLPPDIKLPSWKKVAELWRMENEAVRWIPGAKEVILWIKKHYPGDIQVLVSNTTEVGWWHVDEKLGISDLFGWSKCFLSCKGPVAKPDPFLWQLVKKEYPEANRYWMIGNSYIFDDAIPHALSFSTLVNEEPHPPEEILEFIYGGSSHDIPHCH